MMQPLSEKIYTWTLVRPENQFAIQGQIFSHDQELIQGTELSYVDAYRQYLRRPFTKGHFVINEETSEVGNMGREVWNTDKSSLTPFNQNQAFWYRFLLALGISNQKGLNWCDIVETYCCSETSRLNSPDPQGINSLPVDRKEELWRNLLDVLKTLSFQFFYGDRARFGNVLVTYFDFSDLLRQYDLFMVGYALIIYITGSEIFLYVSRLDRHAVISDILTANVPLESTPRGVIHTLDEHADCGWVLSKEGLFKRGMRVRLSPEERRRRPNAQGALRPSTKQEGVIASRLERIFWYCQNFPHFEGDLDGTYQSLVDYRRETVRRWL